jgi:hypothetical protein
VLMILLAATNAAQPAPTLVSVTRIWDGGAHNAFTDLIRWRNRLDLIRFGGQVSYAG